MRPSRRALARNLLMMTVAWVMVTALAGGVEWAAVSRLAGQGTATAARPLSPLEVRQRLAQASPSHDTASPPRTSERVAQTTTRSWQLTGGKVGSACRGSAIDLLYASPLVGWTYRLDKQTPATISLEFSRGRETAALTARCVKGVPTRVIVVAHDDGPGNEEGSGD